LIPDIYIDTESAFLFLESLEHKESVLGMDSDDGVASRMLEGDGDLSAFFKRRLMVSVCRSFFRECSSPDVVSAVAIKTS
jgi:hypothetical protein